MVIESYLFSFSRVKKKKLRRDNLTSEYNILTSAVLLMFTN